MQWTTILAVCVRVLVAVFTRTFFQPDEYLQSLEPAHVIVFGYGHLTWEWLAERPIRSAVYPALNIPIFWMLKVMGLDATYPSLLVCKAFQQTRLTLPIVFRQIVGPKILHGTIGAITDSWIFELTTKVIGEKYVLTSVTLSAPSLFKGN
jgi:GPI mannosyltransferase 3